MTILKSSNQTDDFATRLKEAMGSLSTSDLANKLGISRQAVSKWLDGISQPNNKRIDDIVQALNTSKQWLLLGSHSQNDDKAEQANNAQTVYWKKVPTLDWDELSDLKNIKFQTRIAEGRFSLAGNRIGDNAFGLIVQDEDMMPRYEPGSTLIIDPDYPLHNKNKVVFLLQGKTPTCKQLFIDGENFYLQSHVSGIKPIEIQKSDIYCGSVRQVLMEY